LSSDIISPRGQGISFLSVTNRRHRLLVVFNASNHRVTSVSILVLPLSRRLSVCPGWQVCSESCRWIFNDFFSKRKGP